MAGQPEHNNNHNNNAEVTLKLAEEQIALTKQKIVDGHVRVTRSTTEHDEVISTLLNREKVEVEHVAKAQPVETMPEIREKNGVLIVPVVEEEIQIVRKLVRKEEIHIRKGSSGAIMRMAPSFSVAAKKMPTTIAINTRPPDTSAMSLRRSLISFDSINKFSGG